LVEKGEGSMNLEIGMSNEVKEVGRIIKKREEKISNVLICLIISIILLASLILIGSYTKTSSPELLLIFGILFTGSIFSIYISTMWIVYLRKEKFRDLQLRQILAWYIHYLAQKINVYTPDSRGEVKKILKGLHLVITKYFSNTYLNMSWKYFVNTINPDIEEFFKKLDSFLEKVHRIIKEQKIDNKTKDKLRPALCYLYDELVGRDRFVTSALEKIIKLDSMLKVKPLGLDWGTRIIRNIEGLIKNKKFNLILNYIVSAKFLY
jgi:hypothetical protein